MVHRKFILRVPEAARQQNRDLVLACGNHRGNTAADDAARGLTQLWTAQLDVEDADGSTTGDRAVCNHLLRRRQVLVLESRKAVSVQVEFGLGLTWFGLARLLLTKQQ
jgi:hypothetical protein